MERKALVIDGNNITEVTDLTQRKALVIVDNAISELPEGDTLAGAGSGGGGMNVVFDVKPSLLLQPVLSAIVGEVKPALALLEAPAHLVTDQKPAITISTSPVTGAVAKPAQNPALALSPVNSCVVKPPQTPSFEMQQIIYTLTRLVGGNAVTLSTTGTQGWTNQNNAISGTNGKHDGSVATFSGNLTATRNGTLKLDYPDHTNKSELAITSVKLRFYYQTAGTVLNNADVQLKWSMGGSDIALSTITGNINALTTPDEFDITSSITSWADLDALAAKVVCNSAAAETWTCTLDAIEVEIIASKTDSL